MRKVAACAALVALSACASPRQSADNAGVCRDYGAQASGAEVVTDGTVAKVLGTRAGRSGEHEGFLLRMKGDCDLLLRVETNVDLTGPVPLHAGEPVVVKGVYVYDPLGGIVHWTHHDPRGRHEGGFVAAGDRTYQ